MQLISIQPPILDKFSASISIWNPECSQFSTRPCLYHHSFSISLNLEHVCLCIITGKHDYFHNVCNWLYPANLLNRGVMVYCPNPPGFTDPRKSAANQPCRLFHLRCSFHAGWERNCPTASIYMKAIFIINIFAGI